MTVGGPAFLSSIATAETKAAVTTAGNLFFFLSTETIVVQSIVWSKHEPPQKTLPSHSFIDHLAGSF